jgi:hypothetical protein
MLKKYCCYCGQDLSERCDCERQIAIERAEMIEDYENSPEAQAGYAFEDKLYTWRSER